MRRSIARLPWRQCPWRPLTASPLLHRPYASAPNGPPSSAPPSTPTASDLERKALVAAIAPQQVPEAPSILSTLPPNLVDKTPPPLDLSIDSGKHESWRHGQAVPMGYNAQIYRICAGMAQEGRNPSRADLDQLFRLMGHDSPYGELKEEAMAVFREMRKRGVVPGKDGFRPLFSVRLPLAQV